MIETLPDHPDSPKETNERQPLFSDVLKKLDATLGTEQPPIPNEPSQQQLEEMEGALTRDNHFETFSEQFRANELMNRRNTLQREAELQDPTKANRVNRPEYVVVGQASTFYEYFPKVVRQVSTTLHEYEALRATLPSVSDTFIRQEQQAALYLSALEQALHERVAYANMLLIDGKLQRHVGDAAALMKLREKYIADPALSAQSRKSLQGNEAEKWKRGNQLNQRFIEILGGKGGINGVPDGFFPQVLLLDLSTERYRQLLEREKVIARDVSLERARARNAELSEKNRNAHEKRGPQLTRDEEDEYQLLQRELKNRGEELHRLAGQRHELTGELIAATDEFGHYQLTMAELSSIQHLFGDKFSFEGVSPSTKDQTPEQTRRAIDESMKIRRAFHAQRLRGFTDALDQQVLTVGPLEITEEFWNDNGREGVRKFSKAMARFFTYPIPEVFGLRQHFIDSLSGPLDEAMGWPHGKEKWEELTMAEQKEVKKRTRSILDAVKSFDRSKLTEFNTTLNLIESMPPASKFMGQEVQEPLPDESVTSGARQTLIEEKYNGATVYAMLFHQLNEQWGTIEPPVGVIGDYAKFLHRVDDVIDTHIDIGDALFRQQKAYEDLALNLAGGALIALLGAWLLREVIGKARGKIKNRELTELRKRIDELEAERSGGQKRPARAETRNPEGHSGGSKPASEAEAVRHAREVPPSQALEELRAARQAGDDARFVRLLEEHASILEKTAKGAATEAKEAEALLRAAEWARTSQWVARGIVGICTAIDIYFLIQNERAIKSEHNDEKRRLLEANRPRLAGNTAIGISMFWMSGPLIAIVTSAMMAQDAYARSIVETVDQWEKSAKDWQKNSDLQLRSDMRKFVIGYKTIGKEAIFGEMPLVRALRIPFTSSEGRERGDRQAYEALEQTTSEVRSELLAAYFLKAAKNDFQKSLVQDKLAYVARATRGTYFVGDRQARFFENCDDFAELMFLKRSSKEQPALLRYTWKGTERVLDLAPVSIESCEQIDCFGAFDQYRNEYKCLCLLEAFAQTDLAGEANPKELLFGSLRHKIFSSEEKVLTQSVEGQYSLRYARRNQLNQVLEQLQKHMEEKTLTPEILATYKRAAAKILDGKRDPPIREGPAQHMTSNRSALVELAQ